MTASTSRPRRRKTGVSTAVRVGILFLASVGAWTTWAWDGPWGEADAPSNLVQDESLVRELDRLPLSGTTPENHTPWSDSYWPDFRGGIAWRFQVTGENEDGRELATYYAVPTEAEVRSMTSEDLRRLSPVEKLDLANRRYDFPMTRFIRSAKNPKDAKKWEGICNGWTAASINHTEPAPKNFDNGDGLVIPFGSSDVKALMSYYYARIEADADGFVGDRCNGKLLGRFFKRGCKKNDMNAGSFHLVLTNLIGLQGRAFAGEMEPGAEVWNHPIYAYRTKTGEPTKASRKAAREAVTEIPVETTVRYTIETLPSFQPILARGANRFREKVYQYILELDVQGRIVGGRWSTRAAPDFLWSMGVRDFSSHPRFGEHFSVLNRIYQPAL